MHTVYTNACYAVTHSCVVVGGLFVIAGLDRLTGSLDWTTGLPFTYTMHMIFHMYGISARTEHQLLGNLSHCLFCLTRVAKKESSYSKVLFGRNSRSSSPIEISSNSDDAADTECNLTVITIPDSPLMFLVVICKLKNYVWLVNMLGLPTIVKSLLPRVPNPAPHTPFCQNEIKSPPSASWEGWGEHRLGYSLIGA